MDLLSLGQIDAPEARRVDESDLVRSICKAKLWDFVQEFWSEITEEPLITNWHMPFLCCQLEKIAYGVIKREKKEHDLLINISPGTSKSTICSVMFPAWLWTWAPWIQVISASFSELLALDLASKTKDVVVSSKYQSAFPEVRLRKDLTARRWYQLTRGGWRYSTGVGGSVTGKHGHIIIIDDPIDPQSAISPAEIKACNEWMTGTISKRKVSHANTVTVMIMQRLAEEDPSALWLNWKSKGALIEHICLPAEETDQIKPKRLSRKYVDGLFDPIRFNREVLEQQKLNGLLTYQSQFLQQPTPPGGGLFRVDKLIINPIDYSTGKWTLVRYWDKASTPEGGAFTVGVLMGQEFGGPFCVLDVVRGQWDPSERERVIRATAERDGTRVRIGIEQEPGSGGKESAEATVRNLAGFRAYADRPVGDKYMRADPFAAQMNAGNVRLRKAEWNSTYVDELRIFSPISKYKDQVDASSGAFSYLAQKKIRIGVF